MALTIPEIQERLRTGKVQPYPPPIPNSPRHWYEQQFSEEQLWQAQCRAKKKQSTLAKKYGAFNNLVQDSGTRWVGDLGEIAFADMLKTHYGFVENIDFTRWTNEEDIDRRDFSLVLPQRTLEIDVKTMTTSVKPLLKYRSNVNARQWRKIEFDSQVNCLVFCYFVKPLNTVYVLGWLLKEEFIAKATFVKAGEMTHKIRANTDLYTIENEKLRPFSKVLVSSEN